MNRYWKLLSWELNRFAKIYGVLWLAVLLSQMTGVFLYARNYTSTAGEIMHHDSLTAAEYTARFRPASFEHTISSSWFEAPFSLCAAALLLYVFLIWYRDWFGKHTFAYRLLMLPTSRMNVFWAKLSAILLFVLGFVAFQLLILRPQMLFFNLMIPSEFRVPESMGELISSSSSLDTVIPRYFIQFVLYYGAGIMAVTVVFTAILLERSFRIKGIVTGIVYAALAGGLLILPVFIANNLLPNYFYRSELYLMEAAAGLVVLGVSLWFSSYLLRNKVTV